MKEISFSRCYAPVHEFLTQEQSAPAVCFLSESLKSIEISLGRLEDHETSAEDAIDRMHRGIVESTSARRRAKRFVEIFIFALEEEFGALVTDSIILQAKVPLWKNMILNNSARELYLQAKNFQLTAIGNNNLDAASWGKIIKYLRGNCNPSALEPFFTSCLNLDLQFLLLDILKRDSTFLGIILDDLEKKTPNTNHCLQFFADFVHALYSVHNDLDRSIDDLNNTAIWIERVGIVFNEVMSCATERHKNKREVDMQTSVKNVLKFFSAHVIPRKMKLNTECQKFLEVVRIFLTEYALNGSAYAEIGQQFEQLVCWSWVESTGSFDLMKVRQRMECYVATARVLSEDTTTDAHKRACVHHALLSSKFQGWLRLNLDHSDINLDEDIKGQLFRLQLANGFIRNAIKETIEVFQKAAKAEGTVQATENLNRAEVKLAHLQAGAYSAWIATKLKETSNNMEEIRKLFVELVEYQLNERQTQSEYSFGFREITTYMGILADHELNARIFEYGIADQGGLATEQASQNEIFCEIL